MPTPRFRTFVWKDSDKHVAYCGYGIGEPWQQAWDQRESVDSELNDYLRTLRAMPPLDHYSHAPMYGNEARTQVAGARQLLKAEGFHILSSRDRTTIKAGKQPQRPVYVMDGFGKEVWYPSVARAAKALGITKAGMVKKCQRERGARYADK